MIGVIQKEGQLPLVEEFFELFKTPWEIYERGRKYDVVVSTGDDDILPDANLLIVFNSRAWAGDAHLGITAAGLHPSGVINLETASLPIYTELLTFVPVPGRQPCLTAVQGIAGVSVRRADCMILRIGFDLFEEVRFLLSAGQPVEHAGMPSLDLHVDMLRKWILGSGIQLVEIPPVPAGYRFSVCLTHDIDFAGIRYHKLDHSIWGFFYRATIGSARNFVRGRLTLTRLIESWRAALSLPFVYLGWAKDFWEPFSWYLKVEARLELPATYYLIPVKQRAGDRVPGRAAYRRATGYDVTDVRDWAARLVKSGCEVGVHGLDAWHNAAIGREEMARVSDAAGGDCRGIRIHWLLQTAETPGILEEAGYAYDSTAGYNETIGFRNGTSQVFRPPGARGLMELPMNIQDGALFYPKRLDLSEADAWTRCRELSDRVASLGGVVTVLWHDRSHGPERFWGDFYIRLIGALKSSGVWFGTAIQVVDWFRARRGVRFRRAGTSGDSGLALEYPGEAVRPAFRVRVQRPSGRTARSCTWGHSDIIWNGASALVLDSALHEVSKGVKAFQTGVSSI